MENYDEFETNKYLDDIRDVKWYAQELIDSSYEGVTKQFLMQMESEYRQAYRTIIGYEDHNGRYIDGYLDAPFWSSVEEGLISCYKTYEQAYKRHPKNTFYVAVMDACLDILEYLSQGLPM